MNGSWPARCADSGGGGTEGRDKRQAVQCESGDGGGDGWACGGTGHCWGVAGNPIFWYWNAA